MGESLRRCRCCQLGHPPAIDRVTGVTAPVCARCTNHQGEQGTTPLRRAQAHEAMLRERLEGYAAREAEARADAAEARRTVTNALASRNRLAARVIDALGQGGGRGGLAQLASDPDVRKWARREDPDDAPFYRSGR